MQLLQILMFIGCAYLGIAHEQRLNVIGTASMA